MPSRLWVAVCLQGSIWMADIQPWNSIQGVSCCVPPGLHLNCWHPVMKFHPVGELLSPSWAPFSWLTSSHEIPSREWVAVHLLGSIWIANIQPWNSIQDVSCCVPPGLHLNGWHPAMKSHPGCELLCVFWAPFEWQTSSHEIPVGELLCASWAPFEWLTSSHEIPSRMWVAVCLIGSIWIADIQPWNSIQPVSCCVPPGLHLNCWHAAMKLNPACELLCASWAPFEPLTCSHKIPSSWWVAVCLPSTWIADMQAWNTIQWVSCCLPPRLHLNCWHAAMKYHPASELLCVSWAPFQSLTCCHHITSSLYLFSPPHSLLYLLTGYIFQVNNVQGLVNTEFNVRLYAILFSCLHWCISNYIGTFAFFHWFV